MAVDIRQRDDVVILKPRGRIIGRSVRDLSKAINDESAKISESPKFLFDFADVSMMDSSGLGTLLGAHVTIAQKGGRVGVINVSEKNVKSLIIRSRLISTFEHFDSEDEAIASLAGG